MKNVTDELVTMVGRELKVELEGFGPKTPVFEGGLELDSFAVVDLITRIENHFGIQLSDDDFRPENFADLETLSGIVQGYLAKKA